MYFIKYIHYSFSKQLVLHQTIARLHPIENEIRLFLDFQIDKNKEPRSYPLLPA